jgi:beta-lactamase regulating signal transducer with metallopeptidase domain
MNSFIETLNHWGGNLLNFAWPMLWQSSLLIVVLLTFEVLFRRKIRASIRYALWLVVLVKLCVPPTLASPTSLAWWLHKFPPPVVAKPETRYTVTYDNGSLPEIPQNPLPAFVPPKPAMLPAAWLVVSSIAVSSALLFWLLVRWWQITRQVHHAKASERLAALVGEAQDRAGTKFNLQVKLTANSMSPAVCGLFCPAILIPQSLVDNFSDEQLCAVLLHELIHLRRRDVWVNFLQALLQIVYWWHPLVWLANAGIRRVREEAVDDAVMLALRDEADSYAPTLLEVAKLALNRPLVSLGLVGILESRHALRQRIERLMDFRPPRRAGLTVVSLLGILAFTAVAVPMGGKPSSNENQSASAPITTSPPTFRSNLPKTVMITSQFYWMSSDDFKNLADHFDFLSQAQTTNEFWPLMPDKSSELTKTLKSSGIHPISSPRLGVIDGENGEINIGNGTNSVELRYSPVVTGNSVRLIVEGKTIESIWRENAKYPVTNNFSANAIAENFGGVVIRSENVGSSGDSNLLVVIGVQLVTNFVANGSPAANSAAKTLRTMTFKLEYPVRQYELKEKLLAAGVEIPPTFFFYEDNGMFLVRGSEEQLSLVERLVMKLNGYSSKKIEANNEQFIKQFSSVGFEDSPVSPTTNLFSRHFNVGTNTIIVALRNSTGLQTNDVSTLAKNLFNKLGVDLDLPGKSVFFNDGMGELFVRATLPDLDTIEHAIEALTSVAPQIHVKARFFEVPKGKPIHLESLMMSLNANTHELESILNQSNFLAALHELGDHDDVEVFAEPEVIMTSGRQCQMKATSVITVVTNLIFGKNGTNTSIIPQMETMETGPVLDVIPKVMSDGYTIDLRTTASVTEFLGYEQPPTNTVSQQINDAGNHLPVILPRIRVQQASSHLKLFDNQTVVLGKFENQTLVQGRLTVDGWMDAGKPKTQNKEVLVLITATVVDPAGNRIHSDEEMSFAKNAIPPQ